MKFYLNGYLSYETVFIGIVCSSTENVDSPVLKEAELLRQNGC